MEKGHGKIQHITYSYHGFFSVIEFEKNILFIHFNDGTVGRMNVMLKIELDFSKCRVKYGATIQTNYKY